MRLASNGFPIQQSKLYQKHSPLFFFFRPPFSFLRWRTEGERERLTTAFPLSSIIVATHYNKNKLVYVPILNSLLLSSFLSVRVFRLGPLSLVCTRVHTCAYPREQSAKVYCERTQHGRVCFVGMCQTPWQCAPGVWHMHTVHR